MPAIPRFVHNLPQDPDGIVITHVLKVDLVYLREDWVWGNRLCSAEGHGSQARGQEAPRGQGSLPAAQLCHSWAGDATCKSMSPGSMRPSAATAPPFMIEPM